MLWCSLFSNCKALAKRTRKLTEVFDLRSTCISFGHPLALLAMTCDDLRRLALTLVEIKFVRKSTQVFTIWPPNASRHKLVASQVYMRKFTAFFVLRELTSRLANAFAHPSQVRTQVLVLQTCIDLRSTCESVWPGLNNHKDPFYFYGMEREVVWCE